MDTHRKILHEQFTSYVGKTSLAEVMALCTIPVMLFSIRHISASLLGLKLRNPVINILWDSLCVISPMILLLTTANQYVLVAWMSASALLLILKLFPKRCKETVPITFEYVIGLDDTKSVLMLLTGLMLLNIDLPVCPRRFAKTHMYGFSLMDTGTGWAIMLSGFSSYHYVLFPSRVSSNFRRLVKRGVLPALFIGSIRVCLISVLNYQQPPEEYGTHWNFFFTFAFTRLFSCVVLSTHVFTHPHSLTRRLFILLAITVFSFLMSSYIDQKISLILTQDEHWPSAKTRSSSLLLANAEGLLSLPGYTVIYFCGMLYMILVRLLFDSSTKKTISLLAYAIFNLFFIIFSYAYLNCLGWHSISRRFANPGYIAFILVVSILGTCYSGLIRYLCGRANASPPSVLMLCTSSFGMAYFLISNVATGIVNLLVDTLSFLPPNAFVDPNTGVYPVGTYSTVVQLLILLMYTVLCVVVVFVFNTKSLRFP
ncbi:Glucosaminyl phosphatidylinositol (GlcN-PI) nositol acylation protein [Clonorchis sinensis]|uniref:Glucosaminyl phosphatidylinositol (GlcN-PI) nositol acylation protein n=2 Tax=Clonorchis sinensis TaxID=79923 RepID=A0A8T1MRU0_CLOSI|nr:Glucosaminyl phosphatidylinositol (GlcN-PI) nositol acylation protein [Clonorchis sinensis]GAA55774.1 phosphatidylinositol glycan class W [Clonorchis sinensis]